MNEIEDLQAKAIDSLDYYKATKIAHENFLDSLKASEACCDKAKDSYESASIAYFDAINSDKEDK